MSIVHYTLAPNLSNSNVSMRNPRLLWGEFPNSSVLNWGLIFLVPGFHKKVHSTPCAPFQLSINRGSEFPHGLTKLVRQSHSFLQENRALISASSQGAAATKRSKAHLSFPPLLSLGPDKQRQVSLRQGEAQRPPHGSIQIHPFPTFQWQSRMLTMTNQHNRPA